MVDPESLLPDPIESSRSISTGDVAAGEGGVVNIAAGDVHYTQVIYNIQSSIASLEQVRDIEDLPPEPGEAPYKGLQYFTEKDAGRFFGREMLTARLVGRITRTRFLAVIGASGSGKSSLVRAGVIPALRRGDRLADGTMPPTAAAPWSYMVFTPTAHPLDALSAALIAGSGDQGAFSPAEITTLAESLAANPPHLALAARQLLERSQTHRLLLVVDQFEEVFTLCRGDEERSAFFNSLVECAGLPEEQPLNVLLVLRADFYANLAQDDRLRELVAQHQEFIGAMSRTELYRAVVQPLAEGDWKIQQGLAEQILDDVGYEPGALPLLSHALLETWKRRRGRTLTLSGYQEAGGVRGAIAQTAEAVFNQRLSPEQRPVARMIFLKLTELGEGTNNTRRRAAFSELITRATDEITIETVLGILTDARLVTRSLLEPDKQEVVEVAHEALIREWPALRAWLEEDRSGLLLRQQIGEAAQEWNRLGNDPGALYRGTRLVNALEWCEAHPDLLSLQEHAFLEASKEAARQEANKERQLTRARILTLASGSLALVVLLLGLSGYLDRRPPPQMNGFYNVAVAQVSQVDAGGRAQLAGESSQISQLVYDQLARELSGQDNIQIWVDSSDLARQKVRIGPVLGETPEQRLQAASAMAERLNADMILFGEIVQQNEAPHLVLKFWVAPDPQLDQPDIQGLFDSVRPVPLAGLPGPSVEKEIASQASAAAYFALGLAEERVGHPLESLDAFRKTTAVLPPDMAYNFIGRGYLFLSDRDTVPAEAQAAFKQSAQQAFEQAVSLNPRNGRALVGLSSIWRSEAHQLVSVLQQPGGEAQAASLGEQILPLLEQAIEGYEAALQIGQEDGLPAVEGLARLGLGTAYQLNAETLFRTGSPDQAPELLERAVETLLPARDLFEQAGLEREVVQTFLALGTVYEWQGFLAEAAQNFEAAADLYRKALDVYSQCKSLAEASSDLIVKEDFAAKRCIPFHETLSDRLNQLQ